MPKKIGSFTLNALGERGKPLLHLFELVSEIMIRLTNTVMKYPPIGVFALITYTVSQHGLDIKDFFWPMTLLD